MPKAALVNLRPLNDHVIVRRDKAEEKSKGGILLPQTGQKKSRRGTVVAVGPGQFIDGLHSRYGPVVEPGSRVIFTEYAGYEVEEGDETLIVLRESEILAICS